LTLALMCGLAAALLWGVTDFLIRVAAHRVGVLRTMLYAQGLGAVTAWLWVAGDPAIRVPLREGSRSAWLAAAGAALVGLGATVALYRGLQRGRASIVAPIASAYGAVTAIASWATGEPLTATVIGAIGAIVVGALLVSVPSATQPPATETLEPHTLGVGWATLACIGYGLSFWIQGRYVNPELGPLLPVALYYLISTIFLISATSVLRPALALSWSQARLVFGVSLAAIAGFYSLSVGLGTGHIAIVTTVGSLQSAVTVALAAFFLDERLAAHHWIGVAAIIIGLGLIRLT
jgi:drug/metabolite transporter (DMT)-like permease